MFCSPSRAIRRPHGRRATSPKGGDRHDSFDGDANGDLGAAIAAPERRFRVQSRCLFGVSGA